jgi:maleamate amidohydrolase
MKRSSVPAMAVDPQARVEEVLRFYHSRGYDRRVGFGSKPAILVIDFSRAFTGGRSEFPGGNFAREIGQTLRMLEVARRSSAVPVMFTTIAYDEPLRDAGLWGKKVPWLEHCRAGTPMVEIDPALDVRPGEAVIVKKFPSSFHGTGLAGMLAGKAVDTLILAGCTTSVCVRATALDAMQHGLRCVLAAEAVGEFDPALHALHLVDLDSRYADVVSVDDVVQYLETITRT